MIKFKSSTKFFFFFFFFFFFTLSLCLFPAAEAETTATGDGRGKEGDDSTKKQGPNFAERAIGFTTDPWNKLRSFVNYAWMNLIPPDSESNSGKESSTEGAATKSFKTSTTTAESVAKTASDLLRETVQKVKPLVSPSGEAPRQEEL